MKELKLSTGNSVYVGQSARDNDNMVNFFFEKYDDKYMWLHMENESGPHVIIYDPTYNEIKEAAIFSLGKARGNTKVLYCNINMLCKNSKCAIGEFIVPDNYKTITVKG